MTHLARSRTSTAPASRSAARWVRLGSVLAATAAACGGAEPRPTVVGPPDLTARPHGPDDPIVARVDGRPVHASCVAAQAAGRRVDRATALDDCIALELLAAAAIARGLDRDPAVAAAGRDAAATALIDREFRARYQRFDDLPGELRAQIEANYADRQGGAPMRRSMFARVNVAREDVDGPRDRAAEAVATAAYRTLAGRGDLFAADVEAAVRAAAAADPSLTVEVARASPTRADFGLNEHYRAGLFQIPAVGMVSPPTRTPWGWDLILFLEERQIPPVDRAALYAKAFPEARRALFEQWSTGLARRRQIRLEPEATLRRRLGSVERGGAAAGAP